MYIFQTPAEAQQVIKDQMDEYKAKIEEGILRLLNENGGTIRVKHNERHAFPAIYSDAGPADVLSLKKISVRNGRVAITADFINLKRRPVCTDMSIGQMLQLWTIAINSTTKA